MSERGEGGEGGEAKGEFGGSKLCIRQETELETPR